MLGPFLQDLKRFSFGPAMAVEQNKVMRAMATSSSRISSSFQKMFSHSSLPLRPPNRQAHLPRFSSSAYDAAEQPNFVL